MSDDGKRLTAAVSGAHIYISVDSGLTWIEQADSGTGNWSSVIMSGDGAMIAAAMNGGYINTANVAVPPVTPPNPPTPTQPPTHPDSGAAVTISAANSSGEILAETGEDAWLMTSLAAFGLCVGLFHMSRVRN